MTEKQTITIHGKDYEMVSSRVARFIEDSKKDESFQYGIQTKLVKYEGDEVIVRASIQIFQPDSEPFEIGSGYAHEEITSSGINSTAALEVCETSAIGRALASIGYAGTEYASADELVNALNRQPSQAPNPATQIRQEHFSGAIKATAIDEQTLTKLNFLPNDLGLPKDQAKAIWGQLWQQGIRRGKFDPNTKKWANTEISTSDIKTIVEMFGGAAGKTSDSIQALTMQLGGDLQVDTPTDVADYSDAPFDDNEPF
jgi:hypothetical protein